MRTSKSVLDARFKKLMALDAMASKSPPAAPAVTSSFVFRPGALGPLAPNVFTTWAALAAVVAATAGWKSILVDVPSPRPT